MPIPGPYSSNQSHRVIELLGNLDQKARSKVNFLNQIVLLLSSSLGSYMNKDIDTSEFSFLFLPLEISYRHWKAVEDTVFQGDSFFFGIIIGIQYFFVTW